MIQIKNRFTGITIFEHDCETIKECVVYAVSIDVNLSSADLRYTDLSGADLSGAYLRDADISHAYLRSVNFIGAYLRDANLSNANLSRAYLRSTNLRGVNLSHVDLSGTDLSGAELSGCNITDIKINEVTFGITLNCPEEGEFIAFKKAQGKIIKIKVLADALRSSATTYKCRCSKALVLEISDGSTEIASDRDSKFIYRVGEVVEVKDFDMNRWNECSTGIHFFMSRQMAENYN